MQHLKFILSIFLLLIFSSFTHDTIKDESLQKELANQKRLIEALKNNARLLGIQQEADSYIIKFSEGQDITLTNDKTPFINIGYNDHWLINGEDTHVGANTSDTDSHTPSISTGNNGNWYINQIDTRIKAKAIDTQHAPIIAYIIDLDNDILLKFADQSSMSGIKYNPLKGHSLYILGDSYSTYSGWIPDENLHYFPRPDTINNVQSVEQTWWHMLCEDLDMKLVKNNSYSGSTICNTGYEGKNVSNNSFIKRMKDDFGPSKNLKADIILIYGGTNDAWADSPLGQPQYAQWTEKDLKSACPAICYMFHYIKQWNPEAIIINLTNPFLKKEIKETFTSASTHYQIHNLVLKDFTKQEGHPNIQGMKSLKNQIKQFLIFMEP